MTEWDYIIVGAGTAGCVLAARLTERPGVRVLVLEAGPAYPRMRLGVPLPGMKYKDSHSWRYLTEPQQHLGGRRIALPMGKVIGGSTAVNAMMYVRGAADVYDAWAQAGNAGWSYDELLPYFRKSERHANGAMAHRGTDGPMHVSDPRYQSPFSSAFVEACLELGIPACPDFSAPHAEGAGFYQVTQRRGERETTGRAYSAPALERNAMQVLTRAPANRLLFDGARVTGVEYHHQGVDRRAFAGEVLLAAGSIASPQLLMLSGVGPAAHLRDLGIAVQLDLPGVGSALQDHARVPVLFTSARRSPGHWTNWVPGGMDYLVRRRGVMVSNCCESGAFVRSAPDVSAPDLQLVTHFQSPLDATCVDIEVCLLRSASRGTLRLRSSDPREAPRIDPNYLSAKEDERVLLRGIAIARRLAQTQALRRFGVGAEDRPGAQATSHDAMVAHVRATAETGYHPAGTCAMGTGPDAVVDAELKVRGLTGVRVVDASIMPRLVAGNSMAATLMIAEKGAAMIAG